MLAPLCAPFASSKWYLSGVHTASTAAFATTRSRSTRTSCNLSRAAYVGPRGAAVMLEPRRLQKLPIVLLNFRAHLPHSWTVQLFTASAEREQVADDCKAYPLLRRALGDGLLLVRVLPTPQRYTKVWYNMYLTTPNFWRQFDVPWLLLFEPDSSLCPRPDLPLRHFLVEDPHVFWGAPWGWLPNSTARANAPGVSRRSLPVGNSGLSLWRRDVMARFADRFESFADARQPGRTPPGPKLRLGQRAVDWGIDVGAHHFLADLHDAGELLLPPFPDAPRAARFSVETTFSGGVPFGAHKAGVNQLSGGKSYRSLLNSCPAAAIHLAHPAFARGGRRARAAVAGEDGDGSGFGARQGIVTEPDKVAAASSACALSLIFSKLKNGRCAPSVSFGFVDERRMWVDGGCRGIFNCSGAATRCGYARASGREECLCERPLPSGGSGTTTPSPLRLPWPPLDVQSLEILAAVAADGGCCCYDE